MGPMNLPSTQHAVQLVGPGQLKLNPSKDVHRPGPRQVLARVECVGLCFSDLKLLKQFDQHARKGPIAAGLPPATLAQIPSYVPGTQPTVPGHEVTCRIVAVGPDVRHHRVGQRVLVQTDYRDLPTASSNAAFGYNFEGALQEYVLMDERVIVDKSGRSFLIPVPEDLSASAVALVEPWACVEDSYVTRERQTVKRDGRMLIVFDNDASIDSAARMAAEGGVAHVDMANTPAPAQFARRAAQSYDDIVYFGARKEVVQALNDLLAPRGILNIVLGGRRIGSPVSVGIGRVHYGMTRWIGTVGHDAAESYRSIPATGELRPGDNIVVIGAGGPMGQMHVIRAVCSGIEGVSVTAADVDDGRLESLKAKAAPLASARGVELRTINTLKTRLEDRFTYVALMAPVGALVASAVRDSAPGCLINVFAGIPAPTRQDLDLDTYIANRCFMFGTSGSTLRDMEIVLQKVVAGQLDTNTSVDAVSGMAGAVDGMLAVEHRTLAGKILVYPQLHEMPLTPLDQLAARFPTVAAKLDRGQWTRQAEQELLRVGR